MHSTGANRRSAILVLLLAWIFGQTAFAGVGILGEPLPTRYRTQARFAEAIEQPVSVTLKGVSLRSLLRRLARDREIAILLDRRIDPDRQIDIDTGERSLRTVVNQIGRVADLDVSEVGNCLVLAPPAAGKRLPTLVSLRQEELARADGNDSQRPLRLKSRRATVAWSDLDRPADILRTIGRQFGLAIAGLEKIPHDLWAGGAMPEATAAEALSIVLNQFDLTFEWTNRYGGVRIVPVPLILPPSVPRETPNNPTRRTVKRRRVPLDKQSFSLQVRDVSLRDLLDELKRREMGIRFDADALRKAGIDLEQKVSLDLPRLPARQFYARLLEPYGLKFHVERGMVIVEPK